MNPTNTNAPQILKANGTREPFDSEKLRLSLIKSGATDEAIAAVLDRVTKDLKDSMTTHDIYQHAYEVLHDWKKPVAERYSLRRVVMNLGPTGFPFEKFVAKLFEKKGYEIAVDQMVMGRCVAHEVDVVAWKGDELIMCEAKFHNELGTKSDLKVALYVKARMDDLKHNTFKYGDKERKVTSGMLVTNTKFSSTAVQYGTCEGLTMIGWNYPDKGSLEDFINETDIMNDLSNIIAKP
jgi:Restriction endonuclease/ATP cone domain